MCPLSPHPTICIVYIMEGSFIVPLCVELITTYMVMMMMMITVTGGGEINIFVFIVHL